jgi:hypothetical protein
LMTKNISGLRVLNVEKSKWETSENKNQSLFYLKIERSSCCQRNYAWRLPAQHLLATETVDFLRQDPTRRTRERMRKSASPQNVQKLKKHQSVHGKWRCIPFSPGLFLGLGFSALTDEEWIGDQVSIAGVAQCWAVIRKRNRLLTVIRAVLKIQDHILPPIALFFWRMYTQVCVYLTIHITKLQLQTTFPKPLYIPHFACIHLDPGCWKSWWMDGKLHEKRSRHPLLYVICFFKNCDWWFSVMKYFLELEPMIRQKFKYLYNALFIGVSMLGTNHTCY